MAHRSRLLDLVNNRIAMFIEDRSSIIRSISTDVAPLDVFSKRFLSGGKRFRAMFCYWGWEGVIADRIQSTNERPDPNPVYAAAAALELFHAAALVHDDIIDHSDTRRGEPSVHRLFEYLHRDSGWAGNGEIFGQSAAILLGDLLSNWSDELFDEGLELMANRQAARAARAEFSRMRTEAISGQYLDVLEEHAWLTQSDELQRSRAERVLVYKAAKYTVEAPLLIGAHIGGANEQQLDAFRDFGLPLGIAFQLRDDLLGVFGDPAITGKPAGDDLREGKRTTLIAITRDRLGTTPRRVLDELLGDRTLTDSQINVLQRTIAECGAADEVESLIQQYLSIAVEALATAPLSDNTRAELHALATSVASRRH